MTISSSPAHSEIHGVLSLHIKDLGDWSHALAQRAKDNQGRLLVKVDGFHGTDTSLCIEKCKHLVVVAGGIGITGFLGTITDALERRIVPKATLIWSTRSVHEFLMFAPVLVELKRQHCDTFDVYVSFSKVDILQSELEVLNEEATVQPNNEQIIVDGQELDNDWRIRCILSNLIPKDPLSAKWGKVRDVEQRATITASRSMITVWSLPSSMSALVLVFSMIVGTVGYVMVATADG